jgi:uncharacterized protein YciI
MHFMVLAWDGTDEGAVARRDEARPLHGASIAALFEAGEVIFGAGILDEDGVVRGSLVVTDHPSRAEVEAYVAADPFQANGTWDTVEIHPLRVPDMYLKP